MKAMLLIIKQGNLYLKGILNKGDMIMKIYKKLFAYVQDKKYLGVLAIVFLLYLLHLRYMDII